MIFGLIPVLILIGFKMGLVLPISIIYLIITTHLIDFSSLYISVSDNTIERRILIILCVATTGATFLLILSQAIIINLVIIQSFLLIFNACVLWQNFASRRNNIVNETGRNNIGLKRRIIKDSGYIIGQDFMYQSLNAFSYRIISLGSPESLFAFRILNACGSVALNVGHLSSQIDLMNKSMLHKSRYSIITSSLKRLLLILGIVLISGIALFTIRDNSFTRLGGITVSKYWIIVTVIALVYTSNGVWSYFKYFLVSQGKHKISFLAELIALSFGFSCYVMISQWTNSSFTFFSLPIITTNITLVLIYTSIILNSLKRMEN